MRWVAFVRNVMVGREGLVRERLVALAREAGGVDVASHLSTGNLTFSSDDVDPSALAGRLEEGVRRVIGREEMVALRTQAWLAELVQRDPFAEFEPAGWTFEVSFVRHDAHPLDPTRLGNPGRTALVTIRDRELLAARPVGGGQRPHVNRLMERATGARATSRGWSTLRRIVAATTIAET